MYSPSVAIACRHHFLFRKKGHVDLRKVIILLLLSPTSTDSNDYSNSNNSKSMIKDFFNKHI